MGDYDTPTECVLLTTWADDARNIDHWVLSHQILPFYATIYGWDFRWIIIAAYAVETVENFVWCLEGAYTEDFSNTSISDPLHGVFGALLGYLFRMTFDVIREERYFIQNARETFITVIDVAAMVAPSLIFYSNNRNLDWLYLLFFPISFAFVSRHEENRRKRVYIFCTAYIYVVILGLVIFGHPLEINSFYSGWLTALGVAICFYSIRRMRIEF